MKEQTYATIHEIAKLLGLQTTALRTARLCDLDKAELEEFFTREQNIQTRIDGLHSKGGEK